MNRRNIITRLSIAALVLTTPASFGQDIHFSQFDMQPLAYNPAFTGMFYGKMRADAIYRNQWNSVTVPYKTIGASIDGPIKADGNGDYLAGGLQIYQDQAGDGNLTSFTGLASLAYHKTFGGNGSDYNGSDLAVGLQGGVAQTSVDLSKLYFGDEFHNGNFDQGTTAEPGLNNHVTYYIVNAGISFAHAVNQNFNFVLGLSANNINQPNNGILKQAGTNSVLDMRYCGQLGLVWNISERLSLRPAVLYQYQASATELIVGNEFHYALASDYGASQYTPAVFVGGWLRNQDAVLINAGFEIKSFRVGVAYDYNISSLNTVSNGNGGFELAARYILPYKLARYRSIPCTRF